VTQVDFYILSDDSPQARLRIACRLADKAVQRSLGVFLLVESEDDAHKLDELLWTFSQNSFLPHRFAWTEAAGGVSEPVVIGFDEHAQAALVGGDDSEDWGLMINLAPSVPAAFGRYERLAEIVGASAEIRERGRERYRFYRERGYTLQTHQI
jgi:DNA polymerase-3 subunit chi